MLEPSALPCPLFKEQWRRTIDKIVAEAECKHILVASWHAGKCRRVKCKGNDSGLEELLGDLVLPWHHSPACDKLFQQHNNLMSHESVCPLLVWRKQFSPKGKAFSRSFMRFLGLILVFKIIKLLWFCTDSSKFYKPQKSYEVIFIYTIRAGWCNTHGSLEDTTLSTREVWVQPTGRISGPKMQKSKRTKGFQAIEARSHEKWVAYRLLIAVLHCVSKPQVGAGQKMGGCATPLG